MIGNKLKINDSKTEYIVFRSLQLLMFHLSSLSVNVGDNHITQSSKVRDWIDIVY